MAAMQKAATTAAAAAASIHADRVFLNKHGGSPFHDLFVGQFRTETKCTACQSVHTVHSHFRHLNVPLPFERPASEATLSSGRFMCLAYDSTSGETRAALQHMASQQLSVRLKSMFLPRAVARFRCPTCNSNNRKNKEQKKEAGTAAAAAEASTVATKETKRNNNNSSSKQEQQQQQTQQTQSIRGPAVRTTGVCRAPELLVLRFGRVHQGLHRLRKTRSTVVVPLRNLCIRELRDDAVQRYELVALVNHCGEGVNRGHYVAHALSRRGSGNFAWHMYDDATVRSILCCDKQYFSSSEAYICVYQKTSKAAKKATTSSSMPRGQLYYANKSTAANTMVLDEEDAQASRASCRACWT
jgi:ubiquitin C-terminal hydrolase